MKTTYCRIYGRFSSKPQERGDSKRRQTEGGINYANKNGLTLVKDPSGKPLVYFDEGVSGKAGLNLEREFGRLLNESKEGETILVEALDRIGRQNPFILGKLLYDTVQKGITIIAWQEGKTITQENIDDLDTQFSVFTGAAVGHADNRRKMTRLKETTQAAYANAKNKIQSGTLVKYLPECFTWNEAQKKIEINVERALVIQRIFKLYADGVGTTRICQILNGDKIPTLYPRKTDQQIGSKKPWIETSIVKVLQNESYAGVLHVKDQTFTCIPHVVSRELFDKVQLLRGRNKKRSGKLSGRVNNLFNGLAVCKHCQGTVNVNVSRPKKAGNKVCYTYRCKNARLHQCSQPHKMLNAEALEVCFMTAYFGGTPENIISDTKELTIQIQAAESKIARLKTAIENLFDMVESGDKTAKDRIAQRREELTLAEDELKTLRGQSTEREELPSMVEEIYNLLGTEEGKKAKHDLFPKLMVKLSDNDTRIKLRSMLPSFFSQVVIDCNNRTCEGITKEGIKLPKAWLKGEFKIPHGAPNNE